MTIDWRKAEPSDLNMLKVIQGKTYIGVAQPITIASGEYETQVRWRLATRKDVRRNNE